MTEQVYSVNKAWANSFVRPHLIKLSLHFTLDKFYQALPSLMPRPHPLTRKGIWWPLSDFLVVASQQNAISHVTWVALQKKGWSLGTRLQIGQLVEHMVAWCGAISLGCSVSRLLTRHNQEIAEWSPAPFLVRGWGLGTRLGSPHSFWFFVRGWGEPGNKANWTYIKTSSSSLTWYKHHLGRLSPDILHCAVVCS